jgi:hypothetical protein
MAKQPELAADNSTPSLRSALWLYFLILLGTAWITISLASNIEPLFIRFAVASFVVLGFTFAACRLRRISITSLFGNRLDILVIVLAALLGATLFFPAQWLSSILEIFLLTKIGALPFPVGSHTNLALSLIIPMCYGLLFWGYMQRAAESAFDRRGAILVGLLFGFYGMFMTNLASSAVPGFLVVGIIAALLVYLTKSMWVGVAVNIGYNLAFLYIQPTLPDFLNNDLLNPFSLRWLMVAIVPSVIAFILFQVIRFRIPAPAAPEPVSQKRLWGVPLVLIAAIYLVVIVLEVLLRSQQPVR